MYMGFYHLPCTYIVDIRNSGQLIQQNWINSEWVTGSVKKGIHLLLLFKWSRGYWKL